MALRELLLKLGVKVDKNDVKKADNALGKMKKAAIAVGTVFVAGKFAQGVGKILELGSAASETTNVINAAFGENADAVERWAKRQSDALGRSRFELREMAAATGAIVEPMLGSEKAAADMATSVSQLAVDLGSFFNANDADALRALQSGLVGSTEPLLKFGVVMKQANLQTFAQQKGIKGLVKDMDEAALTSLRFAFIMEKTKKAQGDAAKTSGGYANATKRLKGELKDQLTLVGQRLLPLFEKLIPVLIKLAKVIGPVMGAAFTFIGNIVDGIIVLFEALRDTYGSFGDVIGTLIIGLGALGIAMLLFSKKAVSSALRAAAAWLVLNAGFILTIALVALILLAIEDFLVFLQGGDSLIGRLVDRFKMWVKEFGGVGNAIKAIFSRIFQEIFGIGKEKADQIVNVFGGIIFAIKEVFRQVGEFIGENLAAAFLAIEAAIDSMVKAFTKAINFLMEKFEQITDAAAGVIETVAEATGLDSLVDKGATISTADRAKQLLKDKANKRRFARESAKRDEVFKKVAAEGLGTFVPANTEVAPGQFSARSGLTGLKEGAQQRVNDLFQDINAPLTVTVDARGQNSPAGIADVTAKAVRKEQNRQLVGAVSTAG